MLPYNGLEFLDNPMCHTPDAVSATLSTIMLENTERFPSMTARIEGSHRLNSGALDDCHFPHFRLLSQGGTLVLIPPLIKSWLVLLVRHAIIKLVLA